MSKEAQNSSSKENSSNYKIKDHQLYLTRLGVLINIFRQNKLGKGKGKTVFKIFFFSIITQIFQVLQSIFFGWRIRKVDFKKNPPIFILGHWRSGTTHLHYLISKDPNLGFVSNYHSFMITFCLLGKGWLDRILAPFMPDKRPMDNVALTLYDPQEEEQATANVTSASGVLCMFFPRNREYFHKYLLFKGISPEEKKKWAKGYDEVLRIVSVANKNKRLLVKNPFNTSRAKVLNEMYPGAKYVYIHRNPYDIYRSTNKLFKASISSQFLQDITEEEQQDIIFENYSKIMQQYIEERNLIPAEDLIEISYDELDEDSIATVTRIYQELNLPGLEEALPHFQAYLDSVEDYEKNTFKPLPDAVVARIQKEWAFAFEEWGYSLEHSAFSMKSTKRK